MIEKSGGKRVLKRIKAYDVVFILLAAFWAVGGLFIPKTGKTALIDSLAEVLFIWCVVIYGWIKILKIKEKNRKLIFIYIVCVAAVLFGIWMSKDFMTDLISGPKETTLSGVNVTKHSGSNGIFSLHYYLNGYDSEGKKHMIEISSEDYEKIPSMGEITVIYYEHINRLYKIVK